MAIKDAAGKNLELKKEAIKWFDLESFETVCELANLSSKRMKSMYGGFMQRKEIKGLLIDNIKECVPYLIPNGNFYRERTYVGNFDGNTITVKIVGKETGNWRNFTKGISGDIIDLWTLVEGDINSAKKWLNTKENTTEHKVLSGAAQLEREMIVERVKNKIATSKEQGLWMGGTLPLGYDVKDKELIINEKEAKTVKHIFERHLELKSMAELARELNSQGYRTKADTFKKATVRRIITNPIYMGKIRHYDKQYEGKHEAIIEKEKWQKAQELIKNQPYRKAKYEGALLRGIIKCKSCGVNMTLTYSKKENKRYRYYVCNNHLRGKGCESENRSVIAGEVEKEIMKKAEQLYENWKEKTEEKIEKLWENLSFGKQKEVVKKLIRTVLVRENGIEVSSEDKVEFIPIKKKGNKCTVVEPEAKTNNALLRAVVRSHLWKRLLEEGKYANIKELSKKINIGTRRIQQILRLNYLAPKIKEDVINGRQPRDLRLADLKEISMLWSEQLEKFYGFKQAVCQ